METTEYIFTPIIENTGVALNLLNAITTAYRISFDGSSDVDFELGAFGNVAQAEALIRRDERTLNDVFQRVRDLIFNPTRYKEPEGNFRSLVEPMEYLNRVRHSEINVDAVIQDLFIDGQINFKSIFWRVDKAGSVLGDLVDLDYRHVNGTQTYRALSSLVIDTNTPFLAIELPLPVEYYFDDDTAEKGYGMLKDGLDDRILDLLMNSEYDQVILKFPNFRNSHGNYLHLKSLNEMLFCYTRYAGMLAHAVDPELTMLTVGNTTYDEETFQLYTVKQFPTYQRQSRGVARND